MYKDRNKSRLSKDIKGCSSSIDHRHKWDKKN